MALGRPIVASSIAAEGIPLKHGEHILIADTEDEFVQSIGTLLEKPAMAQAIGERANQLVGDKFDSIKIGKDLADFYEKQFFQTKNEEMKNEK